MSALCSPGNALIGRKVEVEFNRENGNGTIEYLGWIKGTIVAWNNLEGYLIHYEDGDQEWLTSVEDQDVRLL